MMKIMALVMAMITLMGVIPVSAKNPDQMNYNWGKVYYDMWNKDKGYFTYKKYNVMDYWGIRSKYVDENGKDAWKTTAKDERFQGVTDAYYMLVGDDWGNWVNGYDDSLIWTLYNGLAGMYNDEFDYNATGRYYSNMSCLKNYNAYTLYIHYNWCKTKKVITKKAKALGVTYTETLTDEYGNKYDNSTWKQIFTNSKKDKKFISKKFKISNSYTKAAKKYFKQNAGKEIENIFNLIKESVNNCKTKEEFYYVLDHIETMMWEYTNIWNDCMLPMYLMVYPMTGEEPSGWRHIYESYWEVMGYKYLTF